VACTTIAEGRAVDGSAVARWVSAAWEELEVSDLVIRGDYLRRP
jgi:hypothetical protein